MLKRRYEFEDDELDEPDPKRQKCGGWDPEYPISSTHSSYIPVGVTFIRSIRHKAFQDGVLRIVLEYYCRDSPTANQLYHYEWDTGHNENPVRLYTFNTVEQAFREGLCSVPPVETYDPNIKHFLALSYRERREYVRRRSLKRLVQLDADISEIQERQPIPMAMRLRKTNVCYDDPELDKGGNYEDTESSSSEEDTRSEAAEAINTYIDHFESDSSETDVVIVQNDVEEKGEPELD